MLVPPLPISALLLFIRRRILAIGLMPLIPIQVISPHFVAIPSVVVAAILIVITHKRGATA
jgi:hypothetical protein